MYLLDPSADKGSQCTSDAEKVCRRANWYQTELWFSVLTMIEHLWQETLALHGQNNAPKQETADQVNQTRLIGLCLAPPPAWGGLCTPPRAACIFFLLAITTPATTCNSVITHPGDENGIKTAKADRTAICLLLPVLCCLQSCYWMHACHKLLYSSVPNL